MRLRFDFLLYYLIFVRSRTGTRRLGWTSSDLAVRLHLDPEVRLAVMGGWEADLGEVTEVDGVLYRAGVCGEIVRGPCSAGTTVGMIVVFLLLALVVVQVVVVDLVREWNPSEVAQQLIDRPDKG